MRNGWLALVTRHVESALHPRDSSPVHAAGPLPYRVLLLGGGAAIGLGVSRQERALPGHLARHLASITGRGVDLDVTARLGMTLARARAETERRDLRRYDAIVLTLGVADALTALPISQWRDRLEAFLDTLLQTTSPHARILAIGAHHSSWAPYLPPRLTRTARGRLADFNRTCRELCWSLPRTSYLNSVNRDSADATRYSVLDYERVGRAAAGHLAQRLARQPARCDPPTPEAAADTATLATLGLLDLAPDAVIDRVVAQARRAFGAEGATLTVLGQSARWLRSVAGAQEHSPPWATSLSAAAAQPGGLAIRDLGDDSRFHRSPPPPQPPIAFYAGYPIYAPTGEAVAVLAIFDPLPRTFSSQEMAILRNHALLIQEAITPRAPQST